MFSKDFLDEFEKSPKAYELSLSYATFSRLKNIVDNRGSTLSFTELGDSGKGIRIWETKDETGAISILGEAHDIMIELEGNDDYSDVWDDLPDSYREEILKVMNLLEDAILAYVTGHPSTKLVEDDPDYDYAADFEDSEDVE